MNSAVSISKTLVSYQTNSLVDIPEKVEVDYIRSFILFSRYGQPNPSNCEMPPLVGINNMQ